MQFLKFHSLFQKRRLSYEIYGVSFPSPKNMDYHMQFLKFLSLIRNVDYHMQFMVFVSLLQKHGLSYAISEISFSSPKNVNYHMQFLKFLSLLQKRGLTYAIYGF